MKCKGMLFLAVAVLFLGGTLAAGGEKESLSEKKVSITFMNSKGEIQAQLEEAAKLFEAENPGISVELLAAPVGQSPWEKVMALYAAGNAPTIFMDKATAILKVQDKIADLTNEKWVDDLAGVSTMDLVKIDGKILAFPVTVEGMGLIYNKTLLTKAGVDPESIKTINDLENAFKKVKAAGMGAVTVLPAEWSLGGHFLYTGYSSMKNQSAWDNYAAGLKTGTVDLAADPVVNGLLDSFDLLKKYNINSKDPIAPTQEIIEKQFTSGEAAFYFQGSWVWVNLAKFTIDLDIGFIPVPVSNNASDYGNNGIPVGITKFMAIDTTQNSIEQQNAAKKFLEWFVYSSSGQKALVNECSILPAFKNITITPQDPLSKSLKGYIANGNANFWPLNTPSDHWRVLGPVMQKYLADLIDRDEFFQEMQAYWKTIK